MDASWRRVLRQVPIPVVRVEVGLPGTVPVILRPPELRDHSAWRALRLRDVDRIAPFWATSEMDWAARHTRETWVRHLLDARRQSRSGRGVAFALEVADRFAGELFLTGMGPDPRQAELGIWLDSRLAGQGLGGRALYGVSHFAFQRLGVHRLVAPVVPENHAARRVLSSAGFRAEASMASYMDVGGRRRDHDLWARMSTDRPGVHQESQVLDPAALAPPFIQLTDVPHPRVATAELGISLLAARNALGPLRDRFRRRRRKHEQPANIAPVGFEIAQLDAGLTISHVDTGLSSARLTIPYELLGDLSPGAEVAVAAGLQRAFVGLNLKRVWTYCGSDDSPLRTILRTTGFRLEGVVRELPGAPTMPPDSPCELWAATSS